MNDGAGAGEKGTGRWAHRWGVLLVAASFPLIWMGGLVTTTQAGMAVPDWPNTYGYNLFLYPWYDWFFGPWDLFVEHGHRLLGALAGLINVALVIHCWRSRQPRETLLFAIILLVLVIGQGGLGGIRVLMDERWFAFVHGCTGPLFFATACAFCVTTSKWWRQPLFLGEVGPRRAWSLVRDARCFLAMAYMQLVVGALLRHYPLDASPRGFVHLVYLHLALAALLVMGTLFHAMRMARWTRRDEGLRASMRWLIGLTILQLMLGLATWVLKYGFPLLLADWPVAQTFSIPHRSFWQTVLITGHVATGSLILAFWTVHVVRGGRWWWHYRAADRWRPTGYTEALVSR